MEIMTEKEFYDRVFSTIDELDGVTDEPDYENDIEDEEKGNSGLILSRIDIAMLALLETNEGMTKDKAETLETLARTKRVYKAQEC